MLGAQALTAFGAAAINELTACLGSHASAKAMGALALEVAGLKSSFHGVSLFPIRFLNRFLNRLLIRFCLQVANC